MNYLGEKTKRNKKDVMKMKNKYPKKSKRIIDYHGRKGHPIIHYCKNRKKTYIMVRAKGGGTKRLYAYQKYMK